MKYCFALLISIALLSCQKDVAGEIPQPVDNAPQTMKNVPYGNDDSQKMDVYLPANRSEANTKVMIMIHGGGWVSGDKSEFDIFIDTIKKREPGYAIFNINYRLATGSGNFFPLQENDVKAAVEFIYAKRADYRISDKFVLLGASAGGHLALLQGYKYTSPVKVKAIVDFFGPADITELYNSPASPTVPSSVIASIVGGTPTTNPAIYQQSSPINFVTAQSPPTIILQGGLDPLVSPNQSIALKNKLTTAGVTNQYVFYPTEQHGWGGANLVDSFNKIFAFLSQNTN